MGISLQGTDMPRPMKLLTVIASGTVLLAACSAPPDRVRAGPVDPAIAAALAVPLLTDPDLTTQNARFAAIEVDPFARDSVSSRLR